MKFMLNISIAFMILFSSCSTTRTSAVIPESRPVLKQIVPERKVPRQTPAEVEDLKGILTLGNALRLALLQNPELAVFSLEIRAREAASLQASLFPNPELSIESENFAGSGIYNGVDATETTISLGQLIELGGKREKRAQVAILLSDLAAWDYEAVKLDVYFSVVTLYTQVLSFQEKSVLDSDLLRIAKQLLATVEERVQAGGLSPAETARASVVVSNAEISLHRTGKQLMAARRQLAATWNGRGLFEKASGKLDGALTILPLEAIGQNLDQNPDIARWVVEMDKRRASLQLSEALAVPDPTVSLAYRRINESGDNAFVAGLSIPLLFFNRNQGAIQEARIRLKQGEWEKESRLNILRARLETVYPMVTSLATEIGILKEKSIPNARKAYSIIKDGYQRGKFQLIDVLDAQRTLFEARVRLIESMKNYKIGVSELERLTGQNLNIF